MIEFPRKAQEEWDLIAEEARAPEELRKRLAHATQVEREKEKLKIRHEAKIAFEEELIAANTPELEMDTLATFMATPAAMPSDLIEGAVPDDGLTVITGPSGAGKTSVALQMAYCLLTGTAWLSQPVQQISGGVGVMSYDSDASRIHAMMSGWPNVGQDRVSVVNAYRRGDPRTVPSKREQIVKVWRDMNVEVVIIDSFSASFHGQSQNDTTEVLRHYQEMIEFALTEVGARAIWVIAHSTAASPYKIRGSSAHKDAADGVVTVVADPKTHVREVDSDKYRSWPGGPAQMKPVLISAPDPVTNLVHVDSGAMSVAEMAIPKPITDEMFKDTPRLHEEPDITEDAEYDYTDEEDDL